MMNILHITNQNTSEDGFTLSWEGLLLTITHNLGISCAVQLLDAENKVVSFPMQIDENTVKIQFSEALKEGEVFQCRLFFVTEQEEEDSQGSDGSQTEYYSGSSENIMLFCKSLDISDDRLSTVRPQTVEKYQSLVDEAINNYLAELYFVPITPYNQVQNDGTVKKVFPGKLRLLAIQWTSGLLLQSEFQNLEPNVNEQARNYVDDAKKEMQQITDFSMRIPGQRRKNPVPTMPPNLAPSKTAEWFL